MCVWERRVWCVCVCVCVVGVGVMDVFKNVSMEVRMNLGMHILAGHGVQSNET